MQGGLTLQDATYYSSADCSAVLDEYGILIQELCMLARMHIQATMARLSRSECAPTRGPRGSSDSGYRGTPQPHWRVHVQLNSPILGLRTLRRLFECRTGYCDHQENRKSVTGRDHLKCTQRGTTASRWAEDS